MASIKQNKEFYGNPWTLPEGFYFQNFIDAWNTAKMGDYMLNLRIGYSFGTCNSFNCCAAGSLLLSRFKFKEVILNALLWVVFLLT